MEIQQLRGFLAVCKYRNFTVAAQRTQRTQPTISLQIKSLEDELGVKLFERQGPKRVIPTVEGKLLEDIVSPIIQEFSTLHTRFNEARGLFNTSAVRIATHSSVMIYLLPAVIKQFKERMPECQLVILNRDRAGIVSMVERNEVDFGITSLDVIPGELDYQVFSRFNRILIGNREHPLAKKANISLEDIAKYPLILPTRESNTRPIIDRLFREHGLEYELAMEVVGRTAIKTYVEMDLGISIINEYYVNEEDKKKLFVHNMSHLLGVAETGILTRKGRMLSVPVREFLSLIPSHGAQDLPPLSMDHEGHPLTPR
jgi:DNA-binding transcriptional LysR family regulator